MVTAPQTTPYNRNGVREGRLSLRIPSSGANKLDLPFDQAVGHQSHQREQAKKRWRRPSNRQVAPLSLRFYSQMRPRLFETYFHSPTTHEPTQNLQRRMVEVCRQQRLRLELTQRITDQYPTDWNRHISATIPDCRLGIDFDFTLLPTVPVFDLDLRPLRFRVVEHLLWRRAARPFDPRSSGLSLPAFGRRIVKLRIQAQTRDQIEPRRATDKVKQIQHGEAAIAHENHVSTGQPTTDQLNDLPGAIGQPLMPTLALGVVPLRGAKHSQEWQPPDATGPRDRDQQHAAQPSQATCLDEVRMRGTNRIAVDPFGFDLFPAPSFDGVVDPNHQLAGRGKSSDQQAQQDAARRQGRPSRPIQDSMVTLETLLLAQSHHTQGGGHGAFAGRQNRSDHQDFGVLPNGLGEQGRKLYNQRQQLGRQCQQLKTSRRKSGLQLMRPAVIFSKIKNGQSRDKRVSMVFVGPQNCVTVLVETISTGLGSQSLRKHPSQTL